MNKIFILIFILSFICSKSQAEMVTETGKHRHVGNISKNQSCKIAEQKAKKNAIIKSIGQTISSDVVSNCSEVDGEFECERNQLSLFELNGASPKMQYSPAEIENGEIIGGSFDSKE